MTRSVLAIALAVALLPSGAMSQTRALPEPKPAYAVGDTIPSGLKVATGYPGLDLPTLDGDTCYVRTNEFIYTIHRDTREVIEVQAIADVLIW